MKPECSKKQRLSTRLGVTVLEVLFATVVVVVGLIGIASVIPVAARNAQEATAHTNALNLGLAWSDGFIARGLHQPSPNATQADMSWIWYRDYSADPPNTPGPSWEIFQRRGMQSISESERVAGSRNLRFETPSFSIAPAGRGDGSRRIWGHMPICLDPFFLSAPSTVRRISDEIQNIAPTRIGSYRCSVFPYFNDRYDPALDPFSSPTLTVDQPRMLRVGLANIPRSGPVLGTAFLGGKHPMLRSMISGIFASTDELTVDDSVDESLSAVDRNSRPSRRMFSMTGTNALKSLADGRYTWMATVVPFEPQVSDIDSSSDSLRPFKFTAQPSESALISYVVLNRHSHEYVVGGITPIPGDTESQPTGERITRVYPLSGNFQGGTGGRVRLIANNSVSSKVNVGDWLMLGRYFIVDSDGRPYPFFRWYRVIGASAESEYGPLQLLAPTTSPNDPLTQEVWARDVVLEGPDFAFGPTPTFATLVSGVVTVIERQVHLE